MPSSTRRTLFRKYALYFGALVSALLIMSGAVAGYFAYRQAVTALEEIQRAEAHFAAAQIDHFVHSVQEAVRATAVKFNTTGPVDADDLRIELTGLLRYHPAISELRWIGADGKEQFAMSRFGRNVVRSDHDWSGDPRFRGAREGSGYVGPVYFLEESEPYVTIAAARDSSAPVLSAEVNLKHVWDVVSQVPLAPEGTAYVVDQRGQIVSHPEIGLVLGKTDLSTLPQLRRVLDGAWDGRVIGEARDIRGHPVIATAAPIERLGWTVFAERPLDDALRPVYASIGRSVALVLLGIVAAITASVLLARRMVRPIREIETRARQLGDGQLDRRIVLRTGDEFEGLAGQFNRMAARLQETHAMQETRIAERTHDLAAANEAKTRFLAAATHDLRQPIHALALFVGQLSAIDLPTEGRTLLEKSERSVEALRDLLDACLDLSRLDVGAIKAEPRPLELDDLVSQLVVELAPSAEAKGIALTRVPTSLWVRSDPVLLHRIVLNVLSNAVRYTAEGRILIGCRRRGESVELIVVDTGIGIDPVHLPNVFQEFYRVAPKHDGEGIGLGLGLAIVKRLSVLLGHRVDIESEPGKGTVVRIRMARAEPQRQEAAPRALPADSLHGVRVLVVDDDASSREAMQGLLARWGCEVVTAASGDEAGARAREQHFDVVLCDLNLADESGVAVVDRLRRESGSALACAFVTGESTPDRIAEARATGCPVAFKPTTPAKLRAIVEHLAQSR